MAEKIYYCKNCQLGSQYPEINDKINALTTCTNNNEYIKSEFYQKSYNLLKTVRDFGKKDSNNPKLPNVDAFFSLPIKNLINELITHSFYDDIINALNNNSNSNLQYNIIYGSYWTSLKNILQNVKISNTKYYEQTCCSCHGECNSYGYHCPVYPSGGSNTCGDHCGDYGPGPISDGSYWADTCHFSAKKYKENIHLYDDNATKLINEIQIVDFNYKDDPNKNYKIGFIADDTNEIFASSTHDVMDMYNCIGMLLKAIQELNIRLENLENKKKDS